MTTQVEFAITLENKPGSLAELGEALGGAGVNIEALQGMAFADAAIVHMVADDPVLASKALGAAGIPFTKRDVLTVNVLNEPGTLGEVARVLSAAGINVDAVYVTVGGMLVMGVDDVPGAEQVASGLAVTT